MSSQTDMQALIAKNTRLQAQLEIADSMSASKVTELESKIKLLEQKVAALELDKRMSAAMINAQAPQPAMPTVSSHPVLRGEIARLQQEVAAKDAIIAERDEQVSKLLRSTSSCRETLATLDQVFNDKLLRSISSCRGTLAMLDQVLGDIINGEAAPKEHEPPKEPTPKVAVTESESSAQPISNSLAKGSNDDSRTVYPTQSAGLTPAKSPVDVSPASTVFPKQDYALALRTPCEKLSPRKAKFDQTLLPFSFTRAGLSAIKEAEQQAPSKSQKQQISQKPNRAHNNGNGSERGIPPGRGDMRPNKGQTLHDHSYKDAKSADDSLKAGSQPTQMTQPANVDERAELGVTKVTGGTNQPSRNPNLDPPAATSKSPAEQVLTDKGKETSSDLRGEAVPFIPKSKSIEDLERQTGLTVEQIEIFDSYGFALPSANDAPGTLPQVVAQPVLKSPQSVVPDVKSTTESNVASGLEEAKAPSGPSKSRTTPGIQKVEPDSSGTPQSSANERLPPPESIKESSNDSSAMNSQGGNVTAMHSKVSSHFPSSAAVDEYKKDSSGLRGEAAPFIAESDATAVPGTGEEWDAETTEVFRYFGYRLPTKVDKTKAAIQGVTTQARESEGTGPNIKRRSGDEEQAGTSASSKRLRST